MTIMLVAGEASGDQHTANLFKELKVLDPPINAFGFGGELMAQAGVEINCDLASLAVIGVFEALKKIKEFLKVLKLAEKLMKERKPDVIVLTDFPDLNFRIAAKAKALGIPVIYHISPQIWAWRKGRIHTIKKIVDHMIVLFPFEEPLYQKVGVPVTFVGHPLLDTVKTECDPQKLRKELLAENEGPLVALAPGSRTQEIELLLPIMVQSALQLKTFFPGIRFFVPLARTVSREQVERIINKGKMSIPIIKENALAARAAADLAIISSGTATLETAILNVPMIIGYRMHPLSHFLAKLFVKLPYFGLANLAAGEKIAPEFLQNEFNTKNIVQTAKQLLINKEEAEKQRQGWQRIKQQLGGSGSAKRAAQVVWDVVRQNKTNK